MTAGKKTQKQICRKSSASERWNLRLYVAGHTSRTIAALANLKKICEERMPSRYEYEIEVIDLLVNPQLAAGDQIIAIPTLVRKLPKPMKKLIGDLANEERVLVGLDLRQELEKERHAGQAT